MLRCGVAKFFNTFGICLIEGVIDTFYDQLSSFKNLDV